MDDLHAHLAALPTLTVAGGRALSYRAATDAVAACLYPTLTPDEIDAAAYQRILETADTACRALGYTDVATLAPPAVPLEAAGLYWVQAPDEAGEDGAGDDDDGDALLVAGPGRAEELRAGRLVDARLHRHGLDEVARQHFTIPVTVSDGIYALMQRAVDGPWPNDWKGVFHDILGMCIAAGREVGPGERAFTVLIRGVGRRRYWPMTALLEADHAGSLTLRITLAEEEDEELPFALGHVVMTAGAAALDVDVSPYLARHAAGDWGDLDAFDRQQNARALREGLRLLSAYDVPAGDGATTRIWIITEADRSVTTVLLPSEY